LTIDGNPDVIQGLISITEREDHVYMHLIEHYQKTLGAISAGGQLMVINTDVALKLIDKYFKN